MELAPFLAVALVVVLTPGVDMALVTRNGLWHGRRAALATALGVNVGIAVWSATAAAGLAAVVATSTELFTAIKLVGAAYLVYLGVQALRAARRGHPGVEAAPSTDARRAFRQGLVSNLLNPKIAVFFTSLLPQFVDDGSGTLGQLLLLGAIFNALGVAWLAVYAVAVARFRAVLLRPRVRRALDAVSGTVFVALGIRLALERRA